MQMNEYPTNLALMERAALRRATAQDWQRVLCDTGAPRSKRARYRTGRSLLAALLGNRGVQ